jgi:MFS family permease
MTSHQADRLLVWAIAAGSLIALLNLGIRANFGLFLEPMTVARDWGREIFALAIAIQNLFWGLGQPFAGAVADRFGTARVLVAGGLCYAAGVILMAYSGIPVELYLTAGVLVGMGLAGTSFALVLAAVGRMVPDDQRSGILGLVVAAGSLGQFLLVPLGQLALGVYGWQIALVFLGLLTLAVVPLAFPLRGRPYLSPLLRQQTLSQALREAGGHGSYWYLNAGFFVCGFHVTFIATHLPAYVRDLGLSPQLGAWALALIGLFNVIGAYSAGLLGGRYSRKYLLSSLYLARSVAIALFVLLSPSPVSVLVFSAVIGLLWLSTVPLTSGLVALMFGPRYMATLFGIVFLSHQLGAFLGVWLGGYLFDTVGSYDLVWWLSVALGVLAGLLHWPIREQAVVRPAMS